MKLYFYVFFVLIFAFQACEKKVDNRFANTWYDTEYRILGSSTLQIKKDFTFNYKAAGCTWSSISKGNWKVLGDTIELNSTNVDTCYTILPFVICPKSGKYNNKTNLTTIPNCTAESKTVYIEFKNEKFYLRNDSLIYKLKENSNCPESLRIVFAKTGKTRKKSN